METIKRHIEEEEPFEGEKTHNEERIEFYERLLAVFIKSVKERRKKTFGSFFVDTCEVFSKSIVVGQTSEESLRYLRILSALGVANFESSLNPGKTIDIDLPDEQITTPGTATTAYMDVDTWTNAFCAAVILRDAPAFRALCAVPEETHKTANLRPNAFDLAFVRALKGLYTPDVNIGQLLVDAIELGKEEGMDEDRFHYIDHICVPVLFLAYHILSSDEAVFNEKLHEAALDHRTFWNREEEEVLVKYDPQGWVSLPLTAMAAIAKDSKGFALTFSTDYIPEWLAVRAF